MERIFFAWKIHYPTFSIIKYQRFNKNLFYAALKETVPSIPPCSQWDEPFPRNDLQNKEETIEDALSPSPAQFP